jgi:hypothetical protein
MGITVDNSTTSTPDLGTSPTQPKTSKSAVFKSVLGAVGRGAANMLAPGLGTILGGGISSQVLGSMMPGMGSDVTQYLNLEKQMQQEQISFETMSTVLKIRADSSMSAIRNMKTGG